MKLATLTATLFSLGAMMGCATISTVPDTAGKDGYRYYLPQPYLYVVPDAAGNTVTVKPVFLPDYNRGYTLDAQTFLSKNSLNVTIERGLLQSVSSNSDATLVGAKALEAGGAVAVEMMKAADAAQAEQEAEAEAKRTELLSKLVTAITGTSDAEASTLARNTPAVQQLKKAAAILEKQTSTHEATKTELPHVKTTLERMSNPYAARNVPSDFLSAYETIEKLALEQIAEGHLKGDDAAQMHQILTGLMPVVRAARLATQERVRPQLLLVEASRTYVDLSPLGVKKSDPTAKFNPDTMHLLPSPPAVQAPKPDQYIKVDVGGLNVKVEAAKE